jgi:hypothetical protein
MAGSVHLFGLSGGGSRGLFAESEQLSLYGDVYDSHIRGGTARDGIFY